MYSSMSAATFARGEMNLAVPFQVGRKACHQAMSALASALSRMWWCKCDAHVLREISRRRKRRPAGTSRAANASFPMRDSNSRLVVDHLVDQRSSSCRMSLSLAGGRLISCRVESSRRPNKVRVVDGPSMATRTPNCAATLRKHCSWRAQDGSAAGPAMKKSSR